MIAPKRRLFVALVVILLVLSLVPGIALAQSGVSGTVVVEEGETVSEVNVVSGTVIIEGTVTGDVSAVAGNVIIVGTVDGDLNVASGNIRIAGTVHGDISAAAGNVHLEEGSNVGGNVEVGAGNVRIDGTIEGDARIGADTIQLGDEAAIAGSLTYDGTLEGNLDAVAGDITRDRTLGVGLGSELQPLASWVFAIYAFLLNLLLGAALLLLFPNFSTAVADRVASDPLRTALIGLGVVVAVPLLLVAFALTVIGIPITLAGALAFVVIAWIGLVYGRFALGVWLLSFAEVDNRWVALVAGLLVGAILAQIPFIGGLLNFVIFLLGLGALSMGLYIHRQRPRESPTTESPTR